MELLEELTQYLGQLIQQYGALGIAAAMFAESAGVPFASSVVFFTSGGMIFSGKVSFWYVFIASTLGITFGSIISYTIGFCGSYVGSFIRGSCLKRWIKIKPRDKALKGSKVYKLWSRYGSFSVFMGQFWGVTRTFISFPAGAMHMNILLFILYTALGGAIFSLFAIAFSMAITGAMGLILRYSRILAGISPVVWLSLTAVFAVALLFCWRKGWISLPPLLKDVARRVRNKK